MCGLEVNDTLMKTLEKVSKEHTNVDVDVQRNMIYDNFYIKDILN